MTAIVMGILRHFLTVFGGYLFNKGLLDSNEQEQLLSALMIIAGIAWSVYNKIRANKVKTPTAGYQSLPMVLLCVGALALSGCCNLLATQSHNNRVREMQALRMAAGPNNAVFLGVNLLDVPGWIGAWKEQPGLMATATAADLITGLGAYYLYEQTRTSDDDNNPTVHVEGDDNRVNISGGDMTTSDSTTTTSGAP